MNHADILGLMSPIIALIFSLTFFALWLQQKEAIHLCGFSGAFLMCSIGVTSSHFIIEELSYFNALSSCTIYSLGTSIFFWSHCKRMNRKAPIKAMAAIAVLGIIFSSLVTMYYTDVFLRFYAVILTICMQFTLGSWWIRTKVPCTSENQGLFWTCSFIACLMLFSPPTINFIEGPIKTGQFHESLQWAMTLLYVGLCVIFLAIYLIFGHSKDLLSRIKESSQIDFLTGLKTRQGYEEGFSNIIKMQKEANLPVSIIIADIDNFKEVNDKFGHLAGDRVITAFGSLFNQISSEYDIAGRVGGEEFSLVMWNKNKVAAELIAKQLCSQFSLMQIEGLPKEKRFTASFGVATFKNDTKASLYSKADKALYRAKYTGKNKVCLAQEMTNLNSLNNLLPKRA